MEDRKNPKSSDPECQSKSQQPTASKESSQTANDNTLQTRTRNHSKNKQAVEESMPSISAGTNNHSTAKKSNQNGSAEHATPANKEAKSPRVESRHSHPNISLKTKTDPKVNEYIPEFYFDPYGILRLI